MAQTDYFEDGYVTLDELLDRAHASGAKRIGVMDGAWRESPRGPTYEITAELVTADGELYRRVGRARPGDSKAPNPPPPESDDQVELRAETRAVRLVIKTAYPDKEAAEGEQPAHVKRAQAMVRMAAKRMGLERDELAEVAHKRYGVTSLNDLTPEQADQVDGWLEPFVQGEAA